MKINYYIKNKSFSDEFVLRTLLSLAGFDFSESANPADANLFYGSEPAAQDTLFIEKNGNFHAGENVLGYLNSNSVKFDLVYAAKSLLTDSVNDCSESNLDIHGRLNYVHSFQYKNNLASLPAVNSYINFLRLWIELHLGISPAEIMPPGKKCIIALSHDVDRPIANQFLRNFRLPRKWNLKQKLYHLLRYINARKNAGVFLMEYNKHILDLIELETRYGFKSTFFFCSSNMYSEYGTIYDVPYSINWEDVKQCIKWVKDAGFEVSLHASYRAFESAERIKAEAVQLEEIAESKINGVRHHYWHMGKDREQTLENHRLAGLKYDSSFAFNEHIGFRLSCASCFLPLSGDKKSFIDFTEIPVLCMDGNFFYNPDIKPGEAEKSIVMHIDNLKKVNGIGVFDWHTDSSVPCNKLFANAARTYNNLLEILKADNEIIVMNLGEVHEYFKLRLDKIKEGLT